MIRERVVKKDTIYQYRRVYVRENKSNECCNFQGFPNDYKLYKLAGNAVSVPDVMLISKKIMDIIN